MPFRFVLTACIALWPNLTVASCPDLSLVLAIDSSGSIKADEFNLQKLGYSSAFSSPQVQRALAAAGIVDVAVVFWGDADFGFETIPWHRIESAEDANALAVEILSTERQGFGNTNIGSGLQASLNLLDLPNRCTRRAVINVSGDGKSSLLSGRRQQSQSPYVPLAVARAEAAQLGVTVNALAIKSEEPALEEYYRDNLISGSDSFVMSVAGFDTFGIAIAKKLEREISGPVYAVLGAVPRTNPPVNGF